MGTPALYTISEVARAIGRSPGTLRRWERLGLVSPASQRDRLTKTRLYSESEFHELRRFVGRQAPVLDGQET